MEAKVSGIVSLINLAVNIACEDLNLALKKKIPNVVNRQSPIVLTLKGRIAKSKVELGDYYHQQVLLKQKKIIQNYLDIFNSNQLDSFDSDHLKELASVNPNVFRVVMSRTINQCNKEMDRFMF